MGRKREARGSLVAEQKEGGRLLSRARDLLVALAGAVSSHEYRDQRERKRRERCGARTRGRGEKTRYSDETNGRRERSAILENRIYPKARQ
jgi:hypothetical protein